MPERWREVGERDSWVCGICQDPARPVDPGRQAPDPLAPVVDHIIARSRGGPDTPGNLQIAHFRCNALTHDRPAPPSPAYARAVLSRAVDGTPVPARVWQRYGDSPRRGSRAWRFRHDWLAGSCERGTVAVEPWRLVLRCQRELLAEAEARLSREEHHEGAAGSVNRGRSAAIRAWASEQGYELGSGRIPAAVIAAYQQATRPD